jgi:hypothetical protein
MKFKKFIAISVFFSLALVFLHSEFGLACECHGNHEDHDFHQIISSTIIAKSYKQIEFNLSKLIITSQTVEQIIEFEFLIPINYFYEKSLNLFALKLPTFPFLQSFLF